MDVLFPLYVFYLLFDLILCGDDASVHVHVESAPSGDMGMILPLFQYFKAAALGSPLQQNMLGSYTKWHGDEVHSQGPDAPPAAHGPTHDVLSPRPLNGPASSAELYRPLRIAPDPYPDRDFQPTRPARPRSLNGPASSAELYRPLQIAPEPYPDRDFLPARPARLTPGRLGPHRQSDAPTELSPYTLPFNPRPYRTTIDYDIPFPGAAKRSHQAAPRHQHGGTTDVIPAWVMRKRLLNKGGVRKYLQQYGSMANLQALGDVERMESFDQQAEPVFFPSTTTQELAPGLSQTTQLDYLYQPEYDR